MCSKGGCKGYSPETEMLAAKQLFTMKYGFLCFVSMKTTNVCSPATCSDGKVTNQQQCELGDVAPVHMGDQMGRQVTGKERVALASDRGRRRGGMGAGMGVGQVAVEQGAAVMLPSPSPPPTNRILETNL